MTTVAYKDGVIAYDSRVTASNGVIVDDNFNKMHKEGGLIFFYCGSPADLEDFIKSFIDWKVCRDTELDIEAVVYDCESNMLYRSSIDPDTKAPFKFKYRLDNHYAMGTGSRFALAFMDTGMSAYEAIKATVKRDSYTGGIIKTFKLPCQTP